ncbi:hypothetical protein HMI55_003874 [Coelomomyces lativittatus]|nr:hypothetical protein HMI55_003874 [Coelomomyces lativittatus]
MIHETNAIFQIETLSLLLKQCKFPLDVPFLDPFQALILLSFHHPVSCSELLELCFLHPTIEGQWVYIFSVQVIQNLLCPKPERVMNWEVLHTLVMKTESLALALSRVFTLVHVYQWCPFQKEMLYTFKDLYFHTLTPIKLDVLLPPVTTGSSLPEQFLYLYDQISFASELEKQDFTMRLLPSHFSHLTLTKVPSLLGLFLRVEGGDVSRFFTQLSCIPRFPYSLPTFYLTLVAHRPLFRPFLFKFLLHQLHKAFETDSMLTQHLLELLVTCSSSYPHELVEKVVESWSTVVGTWLNPHYVHFHRWSSWFYVISFIPAFL